MRHLYCLSLIALVACGSPESVPPALGLYVSAQEALAADDFEKARAALQQLAQHAVSETDASPDEVPPAYVPLALAAATAEDITAARAAFKPLSEEIIKGEIPEGYVLAYCPMADDDQGAHWIQKDQPQLMNPYFGATMLHCGVFKD